MVTIANDAIRELLVSRKSIVRVVQHKLSIARQEIASKELEKESEDLVSEVSLYESWISMVVPVPVARADVLGLVESSKMRMASWEEMGSKKFCTDRAS